jgi:hypothetical protein
MPESPTDPLVIQVALECRAWPYRDDGPHLRDRFGIGLQSRFDVVLDASFVALLVTGLVIAREPHAGARDCGHAGFSAD